MDFDIHSYTFLHLINLFFSTPLSHLVLKFQIHFTKPVEWNLFLKYNERESSVLFQKKTNSNNAL